MRTRARKHSPRPPLAGRALRQIHASLHEETFHVGNPWGPLDVEAEGLDRDAQAIVRGDLGVDPWEGGR